MVYSRSNKQIILVSGFSGSGKDTVSKFLPQYKRLAFADELKDQVSDTYNIPIQELITKKGKNKIIIENTLKNRIRSFFHRNKYILVDKTTLCKIYSVFPSKNLVKIRDLLIQHGEKQKEIYNDTYWASLVAGEIKHGNYEKIIITDYRFPIEYEYLYHSLPDYEIKRIRVDRTPLHQTVDSYTENALNNTHFDHVISNNGTIKEFENKVYNFYNSFLKEKKKLIIDIDDTILEWRNAFFKHYRDCEIDNSSVAKFNQSSHFSELKPVEGSYLALSKLKKYYDIVAITSCGTHPTTIKLREKNIQKMFGDLVDYIEYLPLGASKIQKLREYDPSSTSLYIDNDEANIIDARNNGIRSFHFTGDWDVIVADFCY